MNKAKQTINKIPQAKRLILVLVMQMLLLAPLCLSFSAFAQTEVPPDGTGGRSDPGSPTSPGARNTDDTVPSPYQDTDAQTTLIRQAAEQNTTDVIFRVENDLAGDRFVAKNDVFFGLHKFWEEDIVSNLFHNIGQLIGKWISEFINGWVAETVQFLTGFLRVFVLNPNIAINGLGASPSDDISPWVRQGADVMYGIAVDLLLLLFILCIWKYWAEAAWRGGGNLMGAVGRLIFTAGLMLAWPTIYAFEIQITNEMIREVFFNSADQVAALDAAMAAAVKAGLMAGAGLLVNATAGVAGQAFGGVLGAGPGGMVLGTVGGIVAWVGLIIYLVLGGILIAELVYILVLKAIQTALLTAQYMFAPIFLVFFATPDTENVTAGFVRSFVEVSLWTFVWVGLLKIMTIIILSDFNPWGKILMAVGVLQLMIQVPSFLARAQISPMSDFISAGLVTGGLLSAGKALGSTLQSRGMQLADAIGGRFTTGAARGPQQTTNKELNNLPSGVANQKLFNDIKKAGDGKLPTKTQPPLKTIDGEGKDKDKSKIGEQGKGQGINPADKKDGQNNPPKKGAEGAGQGKDLNGLNTDKKGRASVAEGLKDGLGNAAKGIGIGTAAGTAMAGMGAAGALNKKQGEESASDKAAAAALEQAANAMKEGANLQNAGVVPGETGAGSDEEKGKGKGGVETDVKGKVLNQGDAKKDGTRTDAKTKEDQAKTAAALAAGLGLKPPASKSGLGTGAKGEQAERKLTVNQKDGVDKGVDGKLADGVTPPTARDLEAATQGDKDKGVAKDGVPKAEDQSIDMETEPNANAAQEGPGVKTKIEAGRAGAGSPGQKSVKAALATAGSLMAANTLKGAIGGKGNTLDASPPKPGDLSSKGKATVGGGVDPVSESQRELAGAGIVEGRPDVTASGKELKPPVAADAKLDTEVDMAKVQEGDQKSSNAGAVMASAMPLMVGAAVKGAMTSGKRADANVTGSVKGADINVAGGNADSNTGSLQAPQAKLNTTTTASTTGPQGTDAVNRGELTTEQTVSGQVLSSADGATKPPTRDIDTQAQVQAQNTGGDTLKSAAAGAVGAALASSVLRGKGGGGSQAASTADLRGAVLQAGDMIADEAGDAARQAVLNTPAAGGKPVSTGSGSDRAGTTEIDVDRSVAGEVLSAGRDNQNTPPLKAQMDTATSVQSAAAAGLSAVAASQLLKGGLGKSTANLKASSNTDVQGSLGNLDADGNAELNSGTAATQAVLRAATTASSTTSRGGDTNITNNIDVDAERNVTANIGGDIQPPPMQVKPEIAGSADTLKTAAAAGAAAAVTGQLLRGGKGTGAGSITARGGDSSVNIDVDDRDSVQVDAASALRGNVAQAVTAQAGVTAAQAVAGNVTGVDGNVRADGGTAEGRVDQRVEVAGSQTAGPGAGFSATETVSGRVISPPPRVSQVQRANSTVDIQGQQGETTATRSTNAQVMAGGGGGNGNGNNNVPPTGSPPPGSPPPTGGDSGGGAGEDLDVRNSYEDRYNTNNASKPLQMYQQAGYWGIPGRSVVGAIRLAQNTTLGPSTRADGKAELIGGAKGQTFHVRTGEGHSEQQQAMQIMTAGYAGLVGSDPTAYDAARAAAIEAKEDGPKGMAERMAAGMYAYNGGSWSQTANAKQRFQLAMYNHAVEGSQAYVGMQPGNEYTQYLNDRYGPMTPEKQAFGAFATTNAGSPESAWNWAHIPATETLVQNSIPISGMSRAVAANLSVQKAQPWLRGAAIRGCLSYMNGMVDQELPTGTDPMVRDAYVGRAAQIMSPAVVSTCAALAMEVDENAAADVALVNKVASVVGPGKQNHEYVDAYRGYSTATRVAANFASSGAAASAPSSGGSMQVSGGGGGPVSHSISSAGGPAMGGGGAYNEQSYDVEIMPDARGVDMDPRITAADINPGTIGGGAARVRTNVNLTDGGRGPLNVPPSRKMRFEAPVSNQNIQNDIQVGQYRGASHGGVYETHVEGEIIRHGGGSSGFSAMDDSGLNAEVQKMVAQYGSVEDVANKVIVDMKDAGFTFDQISNENAFTVAMQVSATDPSMMQAASIATETMGADHVNYEHVTTVQAIMDADPRNSPRSIESSTIFTAQTIADVSEQVKVENPHLRGVSIAPTQSMIAALGQHDDYIPRMNARETGYKPSVVDFIRSKMEEKLARQNGTYVDPRQSSDSYAN